MKIFLCIIILFTAIANVSRAAPPEGFPTTAAVTLTGEPASILGSPVTLNWRDDWNQYSSTSGSFDGTFLILQHPPFGGGWAMTLFENSNPVAWANLDFDGNEFSNFVPGDGSAPWTASIGSVPEPTGALTIPLFLALAASRKQRQPSLLAH